MEKAFIKRITHKGLLWEVLTLMFLAIMGVLFVNPAFGEEKDLHKSKTQILEDIETIQAGLFKTKECVIEAKTEEELQRCKESLKIRKFEELQEMLFEMGMSREERKMRISPRQY